VQVESHVVHLEDDVAASLGSPVVQNLARNGEPIKKVRESNAIPQQTTAVQVSSSSSS